MSKLWEKNTETKRKKKLLPIFYNKKYNKTSSFISPFKHVVSRVPREQRQMNNEGTTKLAYYILLERTKRNSGWTFRASLFSCSLKTVQSNLDRYCPTVRYSSLTVRWQSRNRAFSEKKAIIWWILPAVCEHTRQMFPTLCFFFLSNITFQNNPQERKEIFSCHFAFRWSSWKFV